MSGPAGDRTRVVIAADPAEIARHAADLFLRLSQAAVASRGRFAVALSGGSPPRALHALLVAPPYREQIPWAAVQFYWGDDRCVPPDDPQSNYRMARETLLDTLLAQADMREDQIHRMRTEL